jgi:thymidine phosphorylase
VDPAAGVLIEARVGDRVAEGDLLLELLYNDPARLAPGRELAERAVRIDDGVPSLAPLLIDRVG